MKFIDRDTHWYIRKVEEPIHIRLNLNNINRDNGIEIQVWMPKIPQHYQVSCLYAVPQQLIFWAILSSFVLLFVLLLCSLKKQYIYADQIKSKVLHDAVRLLLILTTSYCLNIFLDPHRNAYTVFLLIKSNTIPYKTIKGNVFDC